MNQPSGRSAVAARSTSGASDAHVGVNQKLSAWMLSHQMVAVESLAKLLSTPAASALTWLVIAIALTLPGLLVMSLDNMQQLTGRFEASGQMTVYLKPQVEAESLSAIQQRIDQQGFISNVTYVSADEALDEFKANSGLADALKYLDGNPLPGLLLIEPKLGASSEQMSLLKQTLESYRQVDQVQLDMEWLARIVALLKLGERMVWVLSGLLAIAILLVVGNTIRLAIAARVDEIRVVKLVGATNAYVRRPFLYTGLWYGLIGGVGAWIMLILSWWMLSGPVAALSAQYGSAFELKALSIPGAFLLMVMAAILGWLGAWWSVQRHLSNIEP